MLEKNSSIPIYIQLKNILKTSIMNGEIGQNEMIPSESQLAEKYHITRTTVRRAISELVNENLLRAEHGKGTFVSLKPVVYSMWNFSSFTDYVQKKGKIPTSKILSTETCQINGEAYYKLERARGVKENGSTLYLTVDTSFIPLERYPGIQRFDFEQRSLYEVMRSEYSISPSRVELSIKPYIADQRIARIFDIPENTPLILAQGQAFSEDSRQVEMMQVIYSPNVDFQMVTRMDTK